MRHRSPAVPGFRSAGILALCLCAAASLPAPSGAQLEEAFSKYVKVYQPKGSFAQRLIKVAPPPDSWTTISNAKLDYRLVVPPDTKPDTAPAGSRVLRVALTEEPRRPQPVLRIDSFTPEKDEPTEIDSEYAAAYAEQYPEKAFAGKFEVSDSGMILLGNKTRLAMVAGTYRQGAARAVRLQCAYLSPQRQFFITFDCAESEWEQYQDTLARILLSLEIPRRR